MKVFHHFNAGSYTKEIHLEAGECTEKHMHTYDHFSTLKSGIAEVWIDGESQMMFAPKRITVQANKKHLVRAITPLIWLCEHATDCTDPDLIDDVLKEA